MAFEFTPPPGDCSGSVAVEDENIPGDNRAKFSFRVAETLKIALVRGTGGSSDPFYFLRYALDPDGDGRFGVRFEELSPAELGSADLRRFGLVIVAGTVPENRCNEFVKNGGRLWRLPAPGENSFRRQERKRSFPGRSRRSTICWSWISSHGNRLRRSRFRKAPKHGSPSLTALRC
ncbi:MAG: hypothetical protein L6W00_06415 [Lentisphaeria bacterium]|nr:MAG: hypothetical protein L6W00_06415 [Lentisphaeria bacterium]